MLESDNKIHIQSSIPMFLIYYVKNTGMLDFESR